MNKNKYKSIDLNINCDICPPKQSNFTIPENKPNDYKIKDDKIVKEIFISFTTTPENSKPELFTIPLDDEETDNKKRSKFFQYYKKLFPDKDIMVV